MLLERFSILKQFYFSPPTELDLPLELLVSQNLTLVLSIISISPMLTIEMLLLNTIRSRLNIWI